MPVATIVTVAVAGIVAVIGGILTIVHPETLSFDQYVKALEGVVVGTGLLGIGRGIVAASDRKPVDPEPLPEPEPAPKAPRVRATVAKKPKVS